MLCAGAGGLVGIGARRRSAALGRFSCVRGICGLCPADVRRVAAPFGDGGRPADAVRTQTSTPAIAFDTWVLGSYARNHGINVYAGNLLSHFRDLAAEYSVEIAPFVCSEMENTANGFAAAPGFN